MFFFFFFVQELVPNPAVHRNNLRCTSQKDHKIDASFATKMIHFSWHDMISRKMKGRSIIEQKNTTFYLRQPENTLFSVALASMMMPPVN